MDEEWIDDGWMGEWVVHGWMDGEMNKWVIGG